MAAGDRTTILSGGKAIRGILLSHPGVVDRVGEEGIYPVNSMMSERLPRIVYRCTGLDRQTVKNGRPADTALFDLWIYAGDYDGCLEVAEAVDAVLGDFRGGTGFGMTVTRCTLEDTEDNITDLGIFAKRLTYSIRI